MNIVDREAAIKVVTEYLKPGPWDLWTGDDEKIKMLKFKEALIILIPELEGKIIERPVLDETPK